MQIDHNQNENRNDAKKAVFSIFFDTENSKSDMKQSKIDVIDKFFAGLNLDNTTFTGK